VVNALHTPGAPNIGAVGPADARLDDAGLLAVQGPGLLNARTGVLFGPGSTALVTGTAATAPMSYQIAAHHWVTSRGVASDGVYRGAAETVKTVPTGAAPGSGSRIDVIWVKQNDAYSTITPDGSTGDTYGVTQGNSSTGTPAKPSIPVGAEELATATVAAGATATNGAGVTITNTARQVSARGAPIFVRNQAERDAIAAPNWVIRLDTGYIEINLGSGWQVFRPFASNNAGTTGALAGAAPPAGQPLLTKTFTGNLTTNASGDVSLAFPGGAFPNGVCSVNAMVALGAPATAPIFWIGVGCSLSNVSLRAYDASSVAVASLAIASTVIATGW